MAITIKHAKTDTISDWTQTDLDAQIVLGNFPPGTVLADIVLPSDWNNDHTVTGLGTMATQNANAIAVTGGTMSGVSITGYIPTTEKGVALGVATLDAGGQVPLSQIPALGDLNYQGTWNASTNTPTLTSSTGTKGYYYVVNVAGSTNLNGITDWQVSDWAVYNGSAWQKIDNTDVVTSVNGYTGAVVLSYGDITSGIVPVVNGGTGVTTSSGANSVVIRDANANITTNCLFEGFTSQTASGTLITLTASSVQNWVITGSGGQTIKLPNATTLPNGALFTFNNNQSSGTIIVQNNSGTTVDTLQSGAFSTVVLLNNSTSAGSWDKHDQAPANVSWSTNTFDYAGSITSATWNGTAIALNRGGTNASLTAVNGGAVYSTGSALAISAAGTSGQVLTSSGAGAPTWTTPTTGTVTSVTGTSPIASSGGATPAISISQATTSTNGYLSSTDWNMFNGKQPAGTYVTSVGATSPVTSSGGTTPTIAMPAATTSVSGYLTSTDWTTFNNKGSGTVTSVSGTTGRITSTGGNTPVIDLASGVATAGTTGSSTLIPVVTIDTYGRVTSITTASNPQGTVTSVTGTAPVVSSGGATPAISMAAANTTTNGYLTSTDWNTFNGKGSGTVTSASVVSANGFAGTVATATTTPAITLTTTITGLLKGNATAISAATSGTDYSAGTSALTTGILKSTTTTGALSIAVAADFPTLNQNTTGTAANVTGVVASANGGTGFSTYTTGDIIYASATNTLSKLAAGTNGYVLTLASGVPSWAAASGGLTVTSTTSNTNYNLGFQSASSGTTTVDYINTSFTANPSTGDITAPQVVASNGIIVNAKSIANNYTIASGNNAMSVGPVTVATGKSVTVTSGSRWVVL